MRYSQQVTVISGRKYILSVDTFTFYLFIFFYQLRISTENDTNDLSVLKFLRPSA